VDADVATYAPEPVALLWEQGSTKLRTLAELVGVDALPENIQQWIRQTESRQGG